MTFGTHKNHWGVMMEKASPRKAQERNHGGFADEDRRHSTDLKINHSDEEMEREMDVEQTSSRKRHL